MSAWPGKFVIGLTGNIATGKSLVRRMLEHLGAYGIDADALGHRAIARGAPGYQPVVETFGRWILNSDEQIDRRRLAKVVFSDVEALSRLEAIIHPLVFQAVDLLAMRTNRSVIALEAIKLIESGLHNKCDTVWVTHAPQEIQLARLMHRRHMSEVQANQRITAQSPPEDKTETADVVIHNQKAFEDTWQQVLTAWQQLFPTFDAEAVLTASSTEGGFTVQRARPRQAEEIAAFITRLSSGNRVMSREDVLDDFGEKAYMLLRSERDLVGVLGWQVENLVARIDDVYIDGTVSYQETMEAVLGEVEQASIELQCEIILLFVPPNIARESYLWTDLGYELRTVSSLGIRAWQEAAAESMPHKSALLFKQIRSDRVLRTM
jgi:dephospho-CoA kinase